MLDIELPNESSQAYTTENFSYLLIGGTESQTFVSIAAERNDDLYSLEEILSIDTTPTARYCHTNGTDMGEYICKTLHPQGWWICEDSSTCTPPQEQPE